MKKLLLPAAGLTLVALAVNSARLATGARETATSAVAARPASSGAPYASVRAEGRVTTYPGAEVTVGTDLAGTLVRLSVREKDVVKKGDLIAEIRADDHRAALAEARARVAEAEADIRLFDLEVERARSLWQAQVGTRQAFERAERDRDAARARRETSMAAVGRLEAVLEKTRLVAPISGVVIARHAEAGETVEAGARIVTVADLGRTRVEAEVDEFDAGHLQLGSPVTIRAEGWGDRSWRGSVEEIPDAVVARKLRPQDPARPLDTRVLLVKVAFEEPTPLKLGQRVELGVAAPSPAR